MDLTLKREGFWYSKYEPDLLMPKACSSPAPDQQEVLVRLSKREAAAQEVFYRGWSTCRICGCSNGSSEFKFRGWAWPIGLRHYIEKHNVRVSPEFKGFLFLKEV
jgi:hypothetical protein